MSHASKRKVSNRESEILFAIYINQFFIFKSNNLARVRKQNCSSFASFGFERRLVGLANVLQCGWGFFLLFLRGEEKNKINFHQICTVLSKS
jgi:hypothetical protein